MNTNKLAASAKDYVVTDGDDFRVIIRAKDFPTAGRDGEFRVYSVYGDITRLGRLERAIGNLLASRGITKRAIRVSI